MQFFRQCTLVPTQTHHVLLIWTCCQLQLCDHLLFFQGSLSQCVWVSCLSASPDLVAAVWEVVPWLYQAFLLCSSILLVSVPRFLIADPVESDLSPREGKTSVSSFLQFPINCSRTFDGCWITDLEMLSVDNVHAENSDNSTILILLQQSGGAVYSASIEVQQLSPFP